MLIYPLDTPGINPKIVGTKGATLATLHNIGLPIPFTLLICADAFARYFKYTELDDRVRDLLPDNLPADSLELSRLSKEAQLLFQDTPLPDYLEQELTENLSSFSNAQAMVRSSFINHTSACLPPAIFNYVAKSRGTQALIQSIRTVWASLYSVPALKIFAETGIDPLTCGMAVIVQRYVPASGFGSMHSIHPVTGARDTMLLSFAPPLPNGALPEQPDQWIIKQQQNDTNIWAAIPQQPKTQPLPSADIQKLTSYAKEIESIFHLPVHFEFAVAKRVAGKSQNGNGKIYILQAESLRDIPQAPRTWQPLAESTIYHREGMCSALHYPATPLFSSLGLRTMNAASSSENKGAAGIEFTSINGWVYNAFPLTTKKTPSLIQAWFSMLPGTHDKINERTESAALEMAKLVNLEGKITSDRYTSAELFDYCQRLMVYTADMLCACQKNFYSSTGVVPFISNAMWSLKFYEEDTNGLKHLFAADSLPESAERDAYWIAERITDDELRRMIVNMPPDKLASAVMGGNSPMPGIEDAWQQFCEGVQCALRDHSGIPFDLDFSQPTLDGAPWLFIAMIQAVIKQQTLPTGEVERRAEQRKRKLRAKFEKGWPRLFLPFLADAYEWGKNRAREKEDSIAALKASYPLLRGALIQIGEALVDSGLIDTPDSIFWLYENEISEIVAEPDRWDERLSFEEIIAIRKSEWRENLALTPPPFVPADHWLNQTFAPIEISDDTKR